MILEYEILAFPVTAEKNYVIEFTEGTLRVRIGELTFLDAEDVLLVEFAVSLKRWLVASEHGPVDYYYRSISYEDEPIVAFRHDPTSDRFRIESVWSESSGVFVSTTTAVAAAESYFARMSEELWSTLGVDLDAEVKLVIESNVGIPQEFLF